MFVQVIVLIQLVHVLLGRRAVFIFYFLPVATLLVLEHGIRLPLRRLSKGYGESYL